MVSILWLITVLLVGLWVLGYAVNIGTWVNILLAFAVGLLIVNVISMFLRPPVVEREVRDVHHDDVHHRHFHD